MMAAAFLNVPELNLDESEAKRLETSIKRVSKHYPVAVSQKQLDTAMLFMTIAEIYGTRAVAIYTAKKAAPKTAPKENVINFGMGDRGA
jgi:hypothetical protein